MKREEIQMDFEILDNDMMKHLLGGDVDPTELEEGDPGIDP